MIGPRRFPHLVIAAYLGWVLASFVLPLIERMDWRFAMFSHAPNTEAWLTATGGTAGGTIAIPLDELFRYRAGFNDVRLCDQSVALRRTDRRATHEAFARYLARRMAERGVQLSWVELAWRHENVEAGDVMYTDIGRFGVE